MKNNTLVTDVHEFKLENTKYDLICTVDHQGSTSQVGHWIMKWKIHDEEWVYLSDDQQNTTQKQTVISKDNYILLYKKKQIENRDVITEDNEKLKMIRDTVNLELSIPVKKTKSMIIVETEKLKMICDTVNLQSSIPVKKPKLKKSNSSSSSSPATKFLKLRNNGGENFCYANVIVQMLDLLPLKNFNVMLREENKDGNLISQELK